MEIFEGPSAVDRPERHYAGIRVVTPFRGMFAVRDELMSELHARYDSGLTFFRLHVIDMDGPMDIEVGVVTDSPPEPDGRIRPGVLPAGRYAAMTFANHGRRANGTLIDWIRAQDLRMDVEESREGDRFACRYEAYLTDPRTERMKTKWHTEVAIKLR
ncbi:GyrI-like domain-containing protein [Actinoplanes sp. CA-142083]|uniref:GyrI-like domain-containing protein n=1 Tax=Actinoplanes sp. CA-142083 TaxID=3239903 RepID=UPI003D931841